MSSQTPPNKPAPSPTATPVDRDTDGSRNGSGAQTALKAMLKKRDMRVTRDTDCEPPPQDATNSPAE